MGIEPIFAKKFILLNFPNFPSFPKINISNLTLINRGDNGDVSTCIYSAKRVINHRKLSTHSNYLRFLIQLDLLGGWLQVHWAWEEQETSEIGRIKKRFT